MFEQLFKCGIMAEVCKTFEKHEDKIEKTLKKLPDDETIVDIANFFDALGDATRVKIVLALMQEELCTCDLSKITGLSVSAISHQLRVLKDRRIVTYRREGKNVFYKIDDDHIQKIVETTLVHLREKLARR